MKKEPQLHLPKRIKATRVAINLDSLALHSEDDEDDQTFDEALLYGEAAACYNFIQDLKGYEPRTQWWTKELWDRVAEERDKLAKETP